MTEYRRGRVVHEAPDGYRVAEMLELAPAGTALAGFCILGPLASPCIIYASRQQALEALHDIGKKREP